jgi:subtilisin family serine protease
VPGNDPYVITVGGIDNNRTPGYWADDLLAGWSATGPTWDGFAKPDVLAPGRHIISFMYSGSHGNSEPAVLAASHPDYSATISLFRMHGTSMATAVTSGVAALMLQANPELSPDQVKYRLMVSAKPALTGDEPPDLVYNIMSRLIWFTTSSSRAWDVSGLPKPCWVTFRPRTMPIMAWISSVT